MIMYLGEEYSETFSNDYKTGVPFTYYTWLGNGDDSTAMAPHLYLCDDLPIDLTGAKFDNPDYLTSESQADLSWKPRAVLNTTMSYYYPNGAQEVLGNIRYRVYFVKSGVSVTFLGLIGDNRISVYAQDDTTDGENTTDGVNAAAGSTAAAGSNTAAGSNSAGNVTGSGNSAETVEPFNRTLYIDGDMSDLTYTASEGDTTSIFLCWFAFLFLAFCFMATPIPDDTKLRHKNNSSANRSYSGGNHRKRKRR